MMLDGSDEARVARQAYWTAVFAHSGLSAWYKGVCARRLAMHYRSVEEVAVTSDKHLLAMWDVGKGVLAAIRSVIPRTVSEHDALCSKVGPWRFCPWCGQPTAPPPD